MSKRFWDLLSSVESEVMVLIILGGLATMAIIDKVLGPFGMAGQFNIIVGIILVLIFLGYVVRAFYVLINKNAVHPISSKKKLIIVTCDVILFIFFVFLSFHSKNITLPYISSFFAILLWVKVFKEFQESRCKE